MKPQSNLLFFLPVIIASVLVGCSDKQEDMPPFLTIDAKTVNFNPAASIHEIVVKTNVEDWSAVVRPGAATWVEAVRWGTTLKIGVTENKNVKSRKAEINVVAGDLSHTITVEQLGTEPAILLSSDVFTLSAGGGDIALEVTSNIEYDVIIPGEAAWVKMKPGARSGEMVTEKYHFQVDWNGEEVERRVEITVKQKAGTLEKKALIIQKPLDNYPAGLGDDIADDVKVPVNRATASSYQSGGEIEKSFDNSYSTNYHSNWNNSGGKYFPITLDYHFKDQESIDYLVYHPRKSGSNGHFKEVEIWVATESEPALKKLLEHDFKGSGSAAKVVFGKPLVKPLTIRFVVKSGTGDGQGFASCAEMEFYRANPDNLDPLQLFTDQTCSRLKQGITLDNIGKVSNNLYRNIAFQLFNGTYPREFRIQEYKAWPHPDVWAKKNKTNTLSLLDNPTGIAVQEGGELVAFVGETHGYPLSIKIQDLDSPGADGYNNASYYPLSPGVNKIKARNKGLAYVFYHTPDYAAAPPVTIHFATGEVNGYFDSQKHGASDWTRLLREAKNKHFDLLGKYAHLTFETDAFRLYAATNGPQLIDAYDDLVRLEQEFMGLVKYDRPTVNRAYFYVVYKSYMFSTSYRTAYEKATQQDILTLQRLKTNPWGPAHEMGHTLQTRPGFRWTGITEVSNNVHSLYVQTQWGNSSRIESEKVSRYNNRYEKAYNNAFVKHTPHPGMDDVFCKLVPFWQLQLYLSDARGEAGFYKDLYEKIRTSPNKPNAGEQQLDFVRMACEVARRDLTGFFSLWGFLSPFDGEINDYGKKRVTVSQKQIDAVVAGIKMKNYAPVTEKIEYICDSNREIFKNRLPVQGGGKASKNGLDIKINGWKNVVAYEVYDGDQLVFISGKPSFTLDGEPRAIKMYAVAYNGGKTEVRFR